MLPTSNLERILSILGMFALTSADNDAAAYIVPLKCLDEVEISEYAISFGFLKMQRHWLQPRLTSVPLMAYST